MVTSQFIKSSDHINLLTANNEFITGVIQFLSGKSDNLNLQKERLTKDVRYQEFNEVTLVLSSCKMLNSRVTSFFAHLKPRGTEPR